LDKEEEMRYGSATVQGYNAQDSIYFDKKSDLGLQKFNMLMVTNQVGLDTKQIDGIFGLSRKSSSAFTEPLIMD
jgi:hypothetical protein